MSEDAWVKKLDDALAPLPMPATSKWPEGEPYECLLNQPGAQVLIFAPRGTDHQSPHNRDEAYVAARGSATLDIDGTLHPMAAGDFAWVPKNVPHRFIDISDDFDAWVMFFG